MLKTEDLKTAYLKSEDQKYASRLAPLISGVSFFHDADIMTSALF